MFFRNVLINLLLFTIVSLSVFSQPGKNGALTVTSQTVLNNYSPIVSNVAAGSFTVNVLNESVLLKLCPGDLIMLYQAQGATMLVSNNIQYGSIVSYNNAGLYEFAYVKEVNANVITVTAPLVNSYLASAMSQVVKVPQFTTLTVNAGGVINPRNWKDSIVTNVRYRFGGIVAVHAEIIINNGLISSNGSGFRGGQLDVTNQAAYTGSLSSYVSSTNFHGGEKGESINGYQPEYDIQGGRYGRGAPTNGGGGGNAWNAGGGGGSNGNSGSTWTGQGVMLVDALNPLSAWQLDPAYAANGNALTTSSGGGRGGHTVGVVNQNATLVGPNNPQWGLDNRSELGGLGGRPLTNINPLNRIYFGGGGGAGDENNQNGGAGGTGGGIAYVIATNNISGTGTISANGNNGFNTTGNGWDAPGGGGAGGSVVVMANAMANSIVVSARGGNGGSQFISGTEFEGPGGGGGGGYVAITNAVIVPNVQGGIGGSTNSISLTEFPFNGSTCGATGQRVVIAYSFINFNPNAVLNVLSNSPVCVGSVINFTTSSINNGNYSWFGPGGFTSSIQNASLVTNSNSFGTYTVSVGYLNGCIPYTSTISINVSPSPTLSVISSTYCQGQALTLSASGASSFTWQPGNITGNTVTYTVGTPFSFTVNGTSSGCIGTYTSQVNPVMFTPVSVTSNSFNICPNQTITLNAANALSYTWQPGNYTGSSYTQSPSSSLTYTVLGINSMGCLSTETVNVNVSNTGTVFVTCPSTIICAGESTTLTASGSTSYTWNPGLVINNSIVVSPSSTQSYTVNAAIGTCTAMAVQTISVINIPTVSISSNSAMSMCSGAQLVLNAIGATTYTWYPGLVANSSLTVFPTTNQTYTLIGGIGTCTSQAVASVTITSNINISLSASVYSICIGQPVLLTANGGSGFYDWQPNINSNNDSVTVFPQHNTTYTVSSSSGNCVSTKTIHISVSFVNADFTDDSENTTYFDEVNFYNLSQNNHFNYWYINNGYYTEAVNPTVIFSEPGNYAACLMVKNDFGCTDTLCKVISVGCPDDIVYLPNTFTPNGDGLNDVFNVSTLGYCIEKFSLKIYDRWGELIFESEDILKGWDGKFKKEIVKDDVYIYLLDYTMINKKAKSKRGHVSVIK